MPGSGPLGELIGIDYLQMFAGLFGSAGLFYLVLSVIIGDHSTANYRRVGRTMMAAALLAALTYLAGWSAVSAGSLDAGLRPALPIENFAATFVLFGMGALVTVLPRLRTRYMAWLDRRYPTG